MLSAKYVAAMSTEAQLPLQLLGCFISTTTIWRYHHSYAFEQMSFNTSINYSLKNQAHYIQGGSNMTGTVYTCLHTNQSRSYLNHLVHAAISLVAIISVQQGPVKQMFTALRISCSV